MTTAYPRDLTGYGPRPPHAGWPGNARLALSFVVNYEEGGESCVLHGDAASEAFGTDIPGTVARPDARDLNVESMFEYGARAGFWRLMRIFAERGLRFTAYAVGMALERAPQNARAMAEAGHEIAAHGYRWIDHGGFDIEEERRHVRRAVAAIEATSGQRPVGWFSGRQSLNTRRLLVAEGGFLYDSDSFADDLPYWEHVDGHAHLVIPYARDTNDFAFSTAPGFSTGGQFFDYLRDTFDMLYAEGATTPKLMNVGLHCRLAGRPGRAAALQRFLDHVQKHDDVWVCRRADIARHWMATHPPTLP